MGPALIILAAFACDPADGPKKKWSEQDRAETFETVKRTCEFTGASPEVCAALVAVTWRESRGKASVLHTRGENENGSGPHAIGHFWWRKLVQRGGKDDFCDPVISTLAVLQLWQRFHRKGAKTIMHLQRGYGGRSIRDNSHIYADARWCNMLKNGPWEKAPVTWAVDCTVKLDTADLGRPITPETVRSIADEVKRHALLALATMVEVPSTR